MRNRPIWSTCTDLKLVSELKDGCTVTQTDPREGQIGQAGFG